MEKENIFITPYKPKQSVYFLLIVLLIVTITVVISKRKYIIQNILSLNAIIKIRMKKKQNLKKL